MVFLAAVPTVGRRTFVSAGKLTRGLGPENISLRHTDEPRRLGYKEAPENEEKCNGCINFNLC